MRTICNIIPQCTLSLFCRWENWVFGNFCISPQIIVFVGDGARVWPRAALGFRGCLSAQPHIQFQACSYVVNDPKNGFPEDIIRMGMGSAHTAGIAFCLVLRIGVFRLPEVNWFWNNNKPLDSHMEISSPAYALNLPYWWISCQAQFHLLCMFLLVHGEKYVRIILQIKRYIRQAHKFSKVYFYLPNSSILFWGMHVYLIERTAIHWRRVISVADNREGICSPSHSSLSADDISSQQRGAELMVSRWVSPFPLPPWA